MTTATHINVAHSTNNVVTSCLLVKVGAAHIVVRVGSADVRFARKTGLRVGGHHTRGVGYDDILIPSDELARVTGDAPAATPRSVAQVEALAVGEGSTLLSMDAILRPIAAAVAPAAHMSFADAKAALTQGTMTRAQAAAACGSHESGFGGPGSASRAAMLIRRMPKLSDAELSVLANDHITTTAVAARAEQARRATPAQVAEDAPVLVESADLGAGHAIPAPVEPPAQTAQEPEQGAPVVVDAPEQVETPAAPPSAPQEAEQPAPRVDPTLAPTALAQEVLDLLADYGEPLPPSTMSAALGLLARAVLALSQGAPQVAPRVTARRTVTPTTTPRVPRTASTLDAALRHRIGMQWVRPLGRRLLDAGRDSVTEGEVRELLTAKLAGTASDVLEAAIAYSVELCNGYMAKVRGGVLPGVVKQEQVRAERAQGRATASDDAPANDAPASTPRKAKTTAAPITEGATVSVKETSREEYADELGLSQMDGLTVLSVSGKYARVRTANGVTLAKFPLADLTVAG